MDMRILSNALRCAGFATFEIEGRTASARAQYALSGRTHYCEPATLRWHKARINHAQLLSMGAFFLIVESCSADFENSKRVSRAVCFDIFGTVVYRPDLDESSTSTATATTAFYKFWNEFNEVAYYQEELKSRSRRAQEAEIIFNQTLKAAA
jgi:hypothetical protein